jgi:hypothetical protein
LLVAARAGEPELREIAEQAGQQRLTDLTRVIDAIAATGDLRADLDAAAPPTSCGVSAHPRSYLQLTVDRGCRWRTTEPG